MHIALVHRDLHQVTRGGVCTVYRALARQLLDRGHRVTMITQETESPVRLPGAVIKLLPRTEDLPRHRQMVSMCWQGTHLMWRNALPGSRSCWTMCGILVATEPK